MPHLKSLSASQIRYLLAMKELGSDGGGIRGANMASLLGCSKPSVHSMLNTFRDMGLIQKNAYGCAYFTEAGFAAVDRYNRYYQLVARLLTSYFPPDECLQTAIYAFLAELPEERLQAFCQEYAAGSAPLQKAAKAV